MYRQDTKVDIVLWNILVSRTRLTKTENDITITFGSITKKKNPKLYARIVKICELEEPDDTVPGQMSIEQFI